MNANDIVVNYIAAWNERDPVKRRAIAAKTWAPNGSYVDRRYGLHPCGPRWPQHRHRGIR
jgi:hypothetical protein